MNENSNKNIPGDERMEERLWNYIDGLSNQQENSIIESLLVADAVWKEKYEELLAVNQMLSTSDLEAPSMRFTKNVMEEISRLHIAPATRSYINHKIIWSIGFFFIAMIIGFLVYGFAQMDFSGGQESSLSRNFNKIDLSKFFSNPWVNILMMVNVVLGLVILDHYLTRKRNEFRKVR